MALELARALAQTELDDGLHLARVLLLMAAYSGKKSDKPLEGFTKLAKLDFLLRYPNCLERALQAEHHSVEPAHIQDFERTTIESKMIRFRYGPWDHRYRRWVGLLVARGLAEVSVKGRTVLLRLTSKGQDISAALADSEALGELAERANLVVRSFGRKRGTQLKNFIYEVFPEITGMRWGEEIKL